MVQNEEPNLDIIGSIMISFFILLGILRVLGLSETLIVSGSVVAGLLILILYIIRVHNLPLESRSPVGDSIVVLGGLIVLLYQIDNIFAIPQFAIFSPFHGLIVISIGVLSRILLLDRVINSILSGIGSIINGFYQWIISTPFNIVRFISYLAGSILFYLNFINLIELSFIHWIISILYSFPIVVTSIIYRENDSHILLKIGSVVLSIGLLGLLIAQIIKLPYILFVFSLIIWTTSLDFVDRVFNRLVQVVKNHPRGTFQVTLLLFALVAYFTVPKGEILDLSLRIVISSSLAFIAILPTLYDIGRWALPPLYDGLSSLFIWLYNTLRNADLLGLIFGSLSLFSSVYFDNFGIFIRLGLASVGILLLSLIYDAYLMRFYDVIIHGVVELFIGLGRLIKYFIPKLKWSSIISFIAWVMLFFGIFSFLIPGDPPGFVRWVLIFGSIIVWNSATEQRRKRFYGFFNRLFGGIINRLQNFVIWLLRNLWIVILWVVGFGFFIISFGLIFTGSIEFVDVVFANVIENTLVSWIIAISLAGIGVLTLQQSFVKREFLQRNGGKK